MPTASMHGAQTNHGMSSCTLEFASHASSMDRGAGVGACRVIEHSDLPSRPVNYDLEAADVKRNLAVEIGLRRLS
jgi:hypothetical protein